MSDRVLYPQASGLHLKNKGMALSLSSQVLWGTAGNVTQYLFLTTAISVGWLVGFRLILAGIILLGFTIMTHGIKYVTAVWHGGFKNTLSLLIFSIFAMLGIQLTYFMTIKYSNAATATVLQFTSPVLIIAFLAIKHHKLPTLNDFWTVCFAVLGTILLITQGNLNKLSIPLAALIWGLFLATTDALYILLPTHLLTKYGTLPVVAWSFLIGGVIMNLIHPFWIDMPQFSWKMFWILAFMVIPATAIAYLMELQSIPLLRPITISILQAAEPISATVIAVCFMGVSFNWIGSLGIILVISTVFIDALPFHKKTKLA